MVTVLLVSDGSAKVPVCDVEAHNNSWRLPMVDGAARPKWVPPRVNRWGGIVIGVLAGHLLMLFLAAWIDHNRWWFAALYFLVPNQA